ncbi:hypothetical protein ACFUZA_22115 [Streptomyces cellulosae]|uniref:hypothetical protein n=1 Tax=Streptomyces cellulosae TaxID=1968 RepID=UPI0019A5210A|nr:hypothetical protein GCM10018771_15270 [Streptomyces cellulosae]
MWKSTADRSTRLPTPSATATTKTAGRPSPLRATGEARRLELGEPECTGGCCGFLTVVVQRCGGIVQWSDWELPAKAPTRLLDLHFDADQYDAEVARAEADRATAS